MTSHLTLPTGDFTCSLSSGCGAVCSATSLPSGLTSASTPASANSTGSASGATPASPAPDAALPGGWRGECRVESVGRDLWYICTGNFPDEMYFHPYGGWRETCGKDRYFPSESSARAALAAAQPWPGFTPAPSPVEGERAVRYDATGYPSSMGMYVLYVDHKKLTASLRSSLAAARAEVERVDYGSIGEQAKAWEAVCDTAHEVFPGWHHLTNRGIDSMCVLLRNNASSLAAARAEVERAKYVIRMVESCMYNGSGPCPTCKRLASEYFPTVEKGAGK